MSDDREPTWVELAAERSHASDLRAATKLVVAATVAVTDVVQEMHRTIDRGPLSPVTRALSGVVYWQIRNITKLVGMGLDLGFDQLEPILGASAPGPAREAVVAALNGVLGDHLHETANGLATKMTLRYAGKELDLDPAALASTIEAPSGRVVVMVHGSSMHEGQWLRHGHDHGALLARDAGATVLYLRYNSGLHVSTNGRTLSELLDRLERAWPVPLTDLSLLGHSMGGLVSRSAIHLATQQGLPWRRKLRRLVCLGSPHHGAPLERGGNWAETLLGVSAYSAPIARLAHLRSAGITDLRYGNVLDEHWQGRDRFARSIDERTAVPLPEDVACYAFAATKTKHQGKRLAGDGMVAVNSALGRHENPERTLAFPADHQWIAFGSDHFDLLSSPDVYAQILATFERDPQ